MTLDLTRATHRIGQMWSEELVPRLQEYVAIPALSPAFDPGWQESGHIDRAVELVEGWIKSRPVEGMTVSVQRLPDRTPLIVVEIESFGPDGPAGGQTTLFYGHLDKQPEMQGWRSGLSPWTPVIEGDRLYGRGGADDGYAAFASLAAIEAVQRCGGSHGRLVVLIEASEESGSPDLSAHVEALAERLGQVDLVICLDSGCANYDTLWLTTSLRGLVDGTLHVNVVTEGLHSGSVSGVVPSSFRIIRELLDRVENATTGEVLINSANVDIPDYRIGEAEATAALLGERAVELVPFVEGVEAMVADPAKALIARTWEPAISYTGIDGIPPTGLAGNVLRPATSLKLSLRIPPTANPHNVLAELTSKLEADAPYNAGVSFSDSETAPGWNAPDLVPWLRNALDAASQQHFGQRLQLYGEGGTIPFMGMLGQRFPDAQFVITGVLGPESNAHGPNEFLHLGYAEKLTCCLAQMLDASTLR